MRSLKRRGLSGVRLVISDQHAGLVAAIRRCFQGAAHQRCRVHFARNLLANIPKGHQEMVAAAFRTIFAQVSPEEISAQWDHVANMLTERFDKAAALMVRAKEEVLAFGTFPRAHWRQIWSTNPLERLNKEIKRRSRVVGIFPNEEAVIRLCGAVLLDINDEWAASERRYFSKPLWQISTRRAMMTMRHPESSCPPSDRHRGSHPQSPPLRGTCLRRARELRRQPETGVRIPEFPLEVVSDLSTCDGV